jgi:hypothetical protein
MAQVVFRQSEAQAVIIPIFWPLVIPWYRGLDEIVDNFQHTWVISGYCHLIPALKKLAIIAFNIKAFTHEWKVKVLLDAEEVYMSCIVIWIELLAENRLFVKCHSELPIPNCAVWGRAVSKAAFRG